MNTQLIKIKNLAELDQKLSGITLDNGGDGLEIRYAPYIKQRFSNYEVFWNKHIVPLTRRIEDFPPTSHNDKIRIRGIVSGNMEEISMSHYGVFLNIVQALERLNAHPDLSSFDDFYTHLVTAYDLAQERFIDIFEGILKSGVDVIFNFKQQLEFNSLKEFCEGIKKYRRVIVHRWVIGKLISADGIIWVPRKDKVNEYDTWSKTYKNIPNDPINCLDGFRFTNEIILSSNTAVSGCNIVSGAKYDEGAINDDFVDSRFQMESDIKKLEELLNDLWKIILDKIESLRDNPKYLKLQGIELTGNSGNP